MPPGGASGSKKALFAIVGIVVALGVIAAGVLVVQRLGDDGDSAALEHAERVPIAWEGPSSTPDEAWKESVECEDQTCTVIADDQNVYIGASTDGDEGDLTAYAIGSGETRWTRSIDDYQYAFPIDAGVLVQSLMVDEDSGGGVLRLLDPDTGDETWKIDGTFDGFHDGDLIAGVVDGDSTTSRLIDVDTGDDRWDADGRLLSCGSSIIAADDEEVGLRDAASGDEQWSQDLDSAFADGQVWCSDQVVAFPSGDDEIGVVATDDGSKRGTIEVDFDEREETFLRDDTVYIVAGDELLAYDVEGEAPSEAWSGDWEHDVDDAYFVDAGVLLIDWDESAEVFAFDDGTSESDVRLSSYDGYVPTESTLISYSDDRITAFGTELDELWKVGVDDIQEVGAGGGSLFVITDDQLIAYD